MKGKMKSLPHFHQSNGASEKSVDVLMRMIKKNKNKSIKELCFNLNHLVRTGSKASPIEMFFGRNVRGPLPNQFVRECDIKASIEKRVQCLFEVATRKGRYNRDEFEINDKVRIKNMSNGKWDIRGVISEVKNEVSADGSQRAFVVQTENGTLYHKKHLQSSNLVICL